MKKLNPRTLLFLGLFLALCLPVFGFNRIPLHDMMHALMHYNFVAREWVSGEAFLSFWNPYREYGMNIINEHIFNFHPFQYFTLMLAKVFPSQNTITTIKFVYVLVNMVFAMGLYKLISKVSGSRLAATFGAISASFYFPWFASPSFNLTTVWLLPLCYFTAILFFETRKVSMALFSFSLFIFGSMQGNGYLGMMVLIVYLSVIMGMVFQYKPNNFFKSIKLGNKALVIGLIFSVSLLIMGLTSVITEFSEQFFLSGDRDSNSGVNDLRMYLTFATPSTLEHFRGAFLGTVTSRDTIAYAGFLVPVFAIYGCLFSKNISNLIPYIFGFSTSLLLSLGAVSFLALLVFHIPGVPWYRHLGLLLPIVKFHALIIACFGFSIFLRDLSNSENKKMIFRLAGIVLPIFISFFVLVLGLMLAFKSSTLEVVNHSRHVLIVILLLTLIIGYYRLLNVVAFPRKLGILIVCVVSIDGLSFYSQEAFTYMYEISDKNYNLFKANKNFQYQDERYLDPIKDSDYASLMENLSKREHLNRDVAFYDSTFGATDTDLCFSTHRRFVTSVYLKPLYEKLNAVDGRFYPLHSIKALPDFLALSIGCNSNKIKLVDPCLISQRDDDFVLNELVNQTSLVNNIFKIYLAKNSLGYLKKNSCESFTSESDFGILKYSPTRTVIETNILEENGRWMYIAYTWNSKMQAKVDSKIVPLYRANLGFMSVFLPKHSKIVEIERTGHPLLPRLFIIIANIILSIGVISLLFYRPKEVDKVPL